jgi:hypothetical protein
MRLDGSTITRAMNVPVGRVCLDIFMAEVKDRAVIDPDCSDDGRGACANYGFYFRPDDYYECVRVYQSSIRRWVTIVLPWNDIDNGNGWASYCIEGRIDMIIVHYPVDYQSLLG